MLNEQIIREKREEEARKKFNEKWIELLTESNTKKEIEFYTVAEDSISIPLAIMKYRRMLMNRGRGQDITVEELKLSNNFEIEYMQSLLQELFLEPISDWHIDYFYESATKRGYYNMNNAIEELYNRHIEDRGTRFLSIVSTL